MSILKANRIENLTTTDGGINVNNQGRVGIGGVTSPFDMLHVKTATDCNYNFSSAGGTEASLEIFNDAGTANTPLNIRASVYKFKVQSTEKCRITSDGLTFNGDTAAANALSDYEEGTWTPQLYVGSTQQSLDVSYGIYRKIGSLVFIKCHVSPSSVSGSGAVQIRNLPFTQASGGLSQTAVSIQWSGTLGEYGVYANIWRTNDVIQFAKSNAGGNTGSLDGTDIAANSNFGIAGCYEV